MFLSLCFHHQCLPSFTLQLSATLSILQSQTTQNSNKPKPQPRSKMPPPVGDDGDVFLYMPNVPLDLPDIPNDVLGGHAAGNVHQSHSEDIDFDDLSRRFEELTKRK